MSAFLVADNKTVASVTTMKCNTDCVCLRRILVSLILALIIKLNSIFLYRHNNSLLDKPIVFYNSGKQNTHKRTGTINAEDVKFAH